MPLPTYFPDDPARTDGAGWTALLLAQTDDRLPTVNWLGAVSTPLDPDSATGAAAAAPGTALLPEHWQGLTTRPALRGFRSADGGRDAGWSPHFATTAVQRDRAASIDRLTISAVADSAGLALMTELEALAGGALRIRHRLTNVGAGPFHLEGLEVVVPVPEWHDELLDFTGRHERERTPQRRAITDGIWLREGRGGRTGHDAASMFVTGRAGFGFSGADVLAVHVGWSGNVVMALERSAGSATTMSAGELLLPGEISLAEGEEYATPWVYVMASGAGLDGVAQALHAYQRTLPGHPSRVPVTLNVWEAVYFDHDLARLTSMADRAARIGIERFVLDDGWFRGRRDDTAGLGDWWVDPNVWPDGLGPLIDHVTGLGLEFGLWFEPEMVNPDSDLYRAHPDWVLAASDVDPLLRRHQLVLDLTRPEVEKYLFDHLSAVLSEYPIRYVKWDHNRDLWEAGSQARGGRPVVHDQTLAFYRLLDDLHRAHPDVAWESCASGGGRVDLGVLPAVQRVWTSDMTDALSRQHIQRWMGQLVAPEYLGAHVSAPSSHQSGRTFALDFRAATAFFGAFGVEWDLSDAGEQDLDRLAEWIGLHRRLRPLLHTGRVVRIESSDPAVLLHAVVSADRSEALVAHVQLDESASNRGVRVRVPGLDPLRQYRLDWAGPGDRSVSHGFAPLPDQGPTGGQSISGRVLGELGVWLPRRRPESILLMQVRAHG